MTLVNFQSSIYTEKNKKKVEKNVSLKLTSKSILVLIVSMLIIYVDMILNIEIISALQCNIDKACANFEIASFFSIIVYLLLDNRL